MTRPTSTTGSTPKNAPRPVQPRGEGVDPVDRIEWRAANTLEANAWNPNRVHRAELKLLEHSLLSTGWIQPILINPDGIIIDGFHRWRLSLDSTAIRDRYLGMVPCAVVDVDRPGAMTMTIRINRAKGAHVAVDMSAIVRELIDQWQYPPERIAKEIGATRQEVDILSQEGVFAVRNIKDWAYSKAWYPQLRSKVEAAEAVPEPADDEEVTA